MSMRSKLQRLAWRLHARWNADRFQPDYEPRRMVDRFAGTEAAALPAVLGGVAQCRGDSAQTEALNRLLCHFNIRRTPRFLFDGSWLCEQKKGLSGEARRWISLASEQAHEMTTRELPVYDKRAPALRPGFPWGGEWCPDMNDNLFTVRPHRFEFAPRLALAVIGGRYAAEEFGELLRDWMRFASNDPELPFLSNLVVTQRMIATTCAFHFLSAAGADGAPIYRDPGLALMQILSQDVEYLLPRVGKSYPNNHLLVDRFAAWFIAYVYPELCRGRLDLEATETQWLGELERQTYEDGGSFEHSVHYQGLAAEMGAGYLILKQRNAGAVSSHHLRRIKNILRFQADLAGPDGNSPELGDATEDAMFPLDGGSGGTTAAAMREVYRRLFDASIPPLATHHPANEKAFWLLSSDVPEAGPQRHERRLSINPPSGIFVFFDDAESTRCVFRTGPAPHTDTMAGHMHADLMSVCLIRRTIPMLVDAGTYSYRFGPVGSHPNWRQYFFGAGAHNGVVTNGHDPLGTVEGDFRSGPSIAHVRHTSIIEGSGLSFVEATMSSPGPYSGFVRGVIHVRGEYFLVYNVLAGETPRHGTTFPLQLDHRVHVGNELRGALDIVGPDASNMRLVYSDELALRERHHGSIRPTGGWVSPGYGQLLPATQLVFAPAGDGALSAFVFGLNHAAVHRVVCRRIGAGTLGFEVAGTGYTDYLLINPASPATGTSYFGIEFEGRLLWLRSSSKRTELRALEIGLCKAPGFDVDLRFESAQREFTWPAP